MPGETQNPDPRDTERDKFDNVDLDNIHLDRGYHMSREDGMCLMEAVAFLAGEPHTDTPQCVCPVLAAFGRSWNDALDDRDRQRLLKPFIPRLIGTRSTPDVGERRAHMATDWTVRVAAPVWLRAAGLEDEAASLEALPPLDSVKACRKAVPTIRQVREAALVALGAARATAVGAARAAGADDAVDAARAAAVYAAVYAAADPDVHPATTAATAAATAAAVAAAVAATREALRPHVEQLQASAVDLYEQMIEVAP